MLHTTTPRKGDPDKQLGGVHVGLPTRDGRILATAAMAPGSRGRKVTPSTGAVSLLAFGFNHLWCTALNDRAERGTQWFAMLHDDITPGDWWIDALIEEAEKHGADVMSAVSPIKGMDGMSSTAISDPANPWDPLFRLSMKQVNDPAFPATFGIDEAIAGLRDGVAPPLRVNVTTPGVRLLVNTGCFVARLDRPWAEQVRFTVSDRIVREADGKFVPEVEPEDWRFSRDVAALGGKVMATKRVKLIHRGSMDFPSDASWGNDRDVYCAKNGL